MVGANLELKLTVTKKDGESLQLAHWLSLGDDDMDVVERGAADPEIQKKVYISYSKIDTRKAQLLGNHVN